MAKRYANYTCLNFIYNGEFHPEGYNFSELVEVTNLDLNCLEKAFRFKGTLGNHCFIVTPIEEGYRVTGVGTNGRETGSTIITECHTLGYDCGEVWRVLQPEYIKDPLKRVLAQFKLGKNRIKWVDKNFVYGYEKTYTKLGPGYATFESGEQPENYFKYGFSTIVSSFKGGVDQRYYMGDFYIVKNAPIDKVVEFITNVMTEGKLDFPASECLLKTFKEQHTSYNPETGKYETSVYTIDRYE